MSELEKQQDYSDRTCPQCGAAVDSAAPDQPCPACLMQLGLASWQSRDDVGGDSMEATRDSKPRAFQPPTPEELSGLMPNLEVLELLGQGGMGAVYKARQTSLDRLVALKLIRPDAAEISGFAERFTREARALAKLNHPNIVTVHDFGKATQEGTAPLYYLVMEFVEGTDLRHLIQQGDLKPEQALAIVPPLCEALQFAHDAGIVHRDIKPENILIDASGRVKIADFGLARLTGSEASAFTLTGTRQIMGTLRYMAPEQMEASHSVDHRADIYSLGVVFYEMLTGQVPAGQFEPPSKKVQIDVRLDEVVLRSLAREPERRYQQASEVKTEVEVISRSGASLRDVSTDTHSPPTGEPQSHLHVSDKTEFVRAVRQVRRVASLLFLVGVVEWILVPMLAGGFAGWLWKYGPDDWKHNVFGGRHAGAPIAIPAFWLVGLSSLLIFASLKMQQLRFYWLALSAPLIAIVLVPSNLAGLPIGIWALVVLTSQEVRAAFGAVRDGAEVPLESTLRHDDEESEVAPQFSGTVIGGSIVFLIIAVPSALLAWPMWLEPGITLLNWPWPWLGVSLAGVLMTIFGMVAIHEIRNSNGQIIGLGFAVAEAVAFPLLIINGAMFGVLLYFNNAGLEMNFAMSLGLAVGETSLMGGWLSSDIVKRVWAAATGHAVAIPDDANES